MLSTNLTLTTSQAEAVLSRWQGNSIRCSQIEPLQGGMINTALRLTFDQPPFTAVIKLNTDQDSPVLQSERLRLDYLKTHTKLPIPRVYQYAAADQSLPYSYLLIETIPGVNMTQASISSEDQVTIDQELADVLINLHGHTRITFGRIHEPGILSWADFFVPELTAMRKNVENKLPVDVLDDIDTALKVAVDVYKDQGEPTLTHGDIWAGNIMVERQQNGWHLTGLVDPSGAKFTDVEFELAYLQVFNTVGPTFFDIYTASFPLRPGYELRRLFYWLNTYMIHVWLFDDHHYCDRTAEITKSILLHAR